MTTSSDPRAIRQRRILRRSIGLWLILGGIVAVAIAVFALVAVETTIAPPDVVLNCGTPVAPTREGIGICDPALTELWVVGGVSGALGLAALAAGVTLRATTPRPISF